MSGRRGAGLVALALGACTWPNPEFDLSSAGGSGQATGSGVTSSAGPTSSTAGSATAVTEGSGSQGATGSTTTGLSASSTSAGGETVATTLQPQCAAEGQSCGETPCCGGCLTCDAGVCVSACPACQACAQDSCVVTPGAACQLMPGERCEDLLYGIMGQGCMAWMPAPGMCDNAGVCARSCVAPGQVVAGGECSAQCILDPGACQQNTKVSDFSPQAFCAHDVPTTLCRPTCANQMAESVLTQLKCDAQGQCTGPSTSCGKYRCDNDLDNCRTSCEVHQHCAPGFMCDAGQCK